MPTKSCVHLFSHLVGALHSEHQPVLEPKQKVDESPCSVGDEDLVFMAKMRGHQPNQPIAKDLRLQEDGVSLSGLRNTTEVGAKLPGHLAQFFLGCLRKDHMLRSAGVLSLASGSLSQEESEDEALSKPRRQLAKILACTIVETVDNGHPGGTARKAGHSCLSGGLQLAQTGRERSLASRFVVPELLITTPEAFRERRHRHRWKTVTFLTGAQWKERKGV